jgi:hypothetical protein
MAHIHSTVLGPEGAAKRTPTGKAVPSAAPMMASDPPTSTFRSSVSSMASTNVIAAIAAKEAPTTAIIAIQARVSRPSGTTRADAAAPIPLPTSIENRTTDKAYVG